MKNVLVCALAVACVLAAGSAFSQEAKAAGPVYKWADNGKQWLDLSWWGKSGAKPEPFKDPAGRAGYWWWPVEPKSNADDAELWGNRGKVYHTYTPEKPEVKGEVPIAQPPVVTPRKVAFNNVLFDFDKAVLKPEGKAEVDKVIADLKEHPKDTVLIEGHTDNVGSEKYNEALGQRRADAVKKYMVEQGIAADRIQTKSFGLTKPAVPNDTAANRKLNRRVVFDVTVKD